MGLFSKLFGKKNNNGNDKEVKSSVGTDEKNKVSPVSFPEGVSLNGLYMTHQGMAMEPYYIMKATDYGIFMKITSCSPDNLDVNDEDENSEEYSRYFAKVDTVLDDEHASCVQVDENVLRELEQVVVKTGALGFNGFNKHRAMKDVLDAGDSYILFMLLSDGSTVSVNGYNASPKGWGDFAAEVHRIFGEHEDYSRYMIQNFYEAPCERLSIDFYKGIARNVNIRVELDGYRNRWSVSIKDKWGELIEKDTDISDYREADAELPFGRFLDILTKYGAEKWNGISGTSDVSGENFSISVCNSDGKTFDAHGDNFPDGFMQFRNECIKEIISFYDEVK